jgi:ABC-type transport system involved in multi-copper enzyme maturation permease subunit
VSADAVPPKTRPKRLDAFEAVFQVAQLTVKRSLTGPRALVAALVVLLPAVIACIARGGSAPPESQERFFYQVLSSYHFGIAVPVVALVFATAFPWPEAQEGTLTYWFTSPIPRRTVLLGRYCAALLVGSVILTLGLLAIGLPLETRPEAQIGAAMSAGIACTLLAFPAYLALFQLVSTAIRQGLVFGVIFVFIEKFMASLHSTIAKTTIVFYVRSQLLLSAPEAGRTYVERSFVVVEPATTATAVATFAGVTVVALGLSLLLVQSIEYRGRNSQQG